MPQNILQTSFTTKETKKKFFFFLLHHSVWFEWLEQVNTGWAVNSEWCIVGLGCPAVGLQFSIKKTGVQVLHGCTVITNLRPGRHVIRNIQGIEQKH